MAAQFEADIRKVSAIGCIILLDILAHLPRKHSASWPPIVFLQQVR